MLELAEETEKKYKEKVEVIKHISRCEEFEKYKLTIVPQLF